MFDLWRLYWGEFVCVLLFLIVWVLMSIWASRALPEQATGVKKVRNIVAILIVALFVISILNSLSVNAVPRGKVDRRGVNEQQQKFEDKHQPVPPKEESR